MLTSPAEALQPTEEWRVAAFTRIASKTPPLVLEEVPDFVSRNLEYNTVIRQEYAHKARIRLSSNLMLAYLHGLQGNT